MRGRSQACIFASSSTLLLSHNRTFHLKKGIIFISMILLVPIKWLVLYTNDIMVSTKMQTQLILGNHFIQKENM
jgi:hypothetical protein